MKRQLKQRQLKPYMGFSITKYTGDDYKLWKAENENGYIYESKKSLEDLKERIYLDDQSRKLGSFLGRALGIGK